MWPLPFIFKFFLSTLAESLDAIGVSEAADLHHVKYYLYLESNEVNEVQMYDAEDEFIDATLPANCRWTW